jgi:hypothetical protein
VRRAHPVDGLARGGIPSDLIVDALPLNLFAARRA